MEICNDVKYIGVNDTAVDLFEGQYPVPDGIAYNSYLIIDDKLAVTDTVDARFCDEWLLKLDAACNEAGKQPDYLIISHMEPDHSAAIAAFVKKYPNATIVGNKKTFVMIGGFFGEQLLNSVNKLEAQNGGELCLGKTTLKFIFAPMVHWPEVMLAYDKTHKILFSADAFGKFGAIGQNPTDDWACEARRYYFGIVGKYGLPVQNVLKQAAALEINAICPLHGPVLTQNLSYYINLYDVWSRYEAESDGVTIAYTSVYGNTKKAALLLAEKLKAGGVKNVAVHDLARCDVYEAVEDAFKYSKLILATTTYNGEAFPAMRNFIFELKERGYKNRKIGFIENGSWAPTAKKAMLSILDGLNVNYYQNSVTIRSALNEQSLAELSALSEEIIND